MQQLQSSTKPSTKSAGHFREAEQKARQSLAIAICAEHQEWIAAWSGNLARVLLEEDKYDEAEQLFKRCRPY